MKKTSLLILLLAFMSAVWLLFAVLSVAPSVAEDNPCDFHNVSVECVEYSREKAEQGDVEAQYIVGWMYYNGNGVEKDYGEAFRWFLVAAKGESARAAILLGYMYGNGVGVEANYDEALRWYLVAAERGDAQAQYNLGLTYAKGKGVTDGAREARIWLSIAKTGGNENAKKALQRDFWRFVLTPEEIESAEREAARRLAEIENRKNESQPAAASVAGDNPCDFEKVDVCMKYTRENAEHGDAQAQYNLGLMFGRGKDVIAGAREARIWLSIAKTGGNENAAKLLQKDFWRFVLTSEEIESTKREAARRLAEINNRKNESQPAAASVAENNPCGSQNVSAECVEYVREKVEQGDVKSQYILGFMYYTGKGVERDYGEAVRWSRMAAEQGHVQAQYATGLMYENGLGVERDYDKAAHWFRAAAEAGYADAQYELGAMYGNGVGVTKDYDEAVYWWLAAAKQGHVMAQYQLGGMYRNGVGVAKDGREGLRWYMAAAKQGHAAAHYDIGWMYDEGDGVDKDADEALRWYMAAEKLESTRAQVQLGLMYINGEGVEKDEREGLRLLRKAAKSNQLAAEQGSVSAQYNLGGMYDKGEGVEKDAREAYIWFSIAKAGGDGNSARLLQKDIWQQVLTSDGIESAKSEAARRFAEIEKRKNALLKNGE